MHYLIARSGPAHDEPEYRVLRAGSEQRHAGVEAQPAKRCPVDHRAKLLFGHERFGRTACPFSPATVHRGPPSCRRVRRCEVTFSTDSTALRSRARLGCT